MVITNVMLAAGQLVISFTISFMIFFIYSDKPKEKKKKLIQETMSQLINFIIFIWLIKIILNFSLFIKAPLTILAYPSDSYTFYFAFLLNSIIFIYFNRKSKSDAADFTEAFTIIFLIASINYEFIQFISVNNNSSFGYLLLLSVILLIFLILQGRFKAKLLLIVISFLWSGGMLALLNIYPVITVFDYIIRPWFLPLFFIMSTLLLFLTIREGEI